MKTIKIPDSAFSVLQTDVHDALLTDADWGFADEFEEQFVFQHIDWDRQRLRIPDSQTDRELLASSLNALSNLYDDIAEHGHGTDEKRFGRNASRALGTLATKVRS